MPPLRTVDALVPSDSLLADDFDGSVGIDAESSKIPVDSLDSVGVRVTTYVVVSMNEVIEFAVFECKFRLVS